MTNLRTALAALVVVLLVLGWGGAAFAAMNGTATEWAVKMDAAPIRTLALVVLIGATIAAFVPEREAAS